MAAKKRKRLTMDELVVNAKKFLKGKQLESNNRTMFENALKKAVVPKQRGLNSCKVLTNNILLLIYLHQLRGTKDDLFSEYTITHNHRPLLPPPSPS